MCTETKYRNNLEEFKKTKTYKVWLYESLGKLKVVGQQAKAKMNELRINTIVDLYLHHHGIPKVPL